MKPFDDSIPEEIETQHVALVSMLRRAYPRPVQLTSEEQTQIIERASQRLLLHDQSISAGKNQAPVGTISSIPLEKPVANSFAVRRRRSITRFASMLVAVLVVAAIIGASLVLFTHRPQGVVTKLPQGAPVGPVGKISIVTVTGGLEASMSITGGPYFLSELLAADISLTNQTDKTMYVGIPFAGSACGYITGVQVTGKDTPEFVIPIPTDHSCPFFVNSTPLKPGQTLTVHKYLPLTNSGHLTLTAETAFFASPRQSQNPFPKQISSPLDGHWPSIQIDVAPKVPSDRTISYHRDGSRVFIIAPTDAQHQLQYLYGVSCSDYTGPGGTGSGNYGWETLPKNVVGEPGCPGKNVRWAFAFGLPGYAIVQGSVTFPGNSPNP